MARKVLSDTKVIKRGAKAAAKTMQKVGSGKEIPRGVKEIEDNQLEAFENRTKNRRYKVEFTCPEFTCVCPKTGFPDFATIYISYVPDNRCVELKSLKLYINGYRDVGVFHEDVTNIIMTDLIDLLDPWELEVIADFTVRGNIHTVVSAYHTKEKNRDKCILQS